MKNIVEIKDMCLRYNTPEGETEAVKNLNLSVQSGEFVSIVGPSGCGKSTILSIIAGLLKPTSGTISVNTNSITGYMLQKDYLFEWRTVFDNVCLGAEIQKNLTEEKKEYANQLLDQYGLKDFKNSYPSQLSGGMKQRVALIRTLLLKPELLLLDEPFSALDYQTRLFVADEIGTIIRKEKKTAILVTHDISEAISLSDKVFVLTKRPATLKSIYEIKLTADDRTPMKSREAPEFKDYFNNIWKELDVHV